MTNILLGILIVIGVANLIDNLSHKRVCEYTRRRNNLWLSYLVHSHWIGLMSMEEKPDDKLMKIIDELRASDGQR